MRYIIFIILFSFIYNINKFMELQTVYENVVVGNLSTIIPRLGVTPLRQSPVYHTIHITTNTVVMGNYPPPHHLLHHLLRHPPHHPGHNPQLQGGEGHGCSHQEA